MADVPDIDLSSLGVKSYGSFSVEVVDPVSDYLELMEVSNSTSIFSYNMSSYTDFLNFP
jgi:hypothetical protein